MVVKKTIKVEIAYASGDQQHIIPIEIEPGSTLQMAIECSGIKALCPEIDINKQPVGVFSKRRSYTDIVDAGDRIEIYHPLLIDPKEVRRKKAHQEDKD